MLYPVFIFSKWMLFVLHVNVTNLSHNSLITEHVMCIWSCFLISMCPCFYSYFYGPKLLITPRITGNIAACVSFFFFKVAHYTFTNCGYALLVPFTPSPILNVNELVVFWSQCLFAWTPCNNMHSSFGHIYADTGVNNNDTRVAAVVIDSLKIKWTSWLHCSLM